MKKQVSSTSLKSLDENSHDIEGSEEADRKQVQSSQGENDKRNLVYYCHVVF